MTKTTISWTDETWNPVHGCSKVSPGCAHCYAEGISLRYGITKKPWIEANAKENVILRPDKLDMPSRWRKPRMIFVNSMSDLFHPLVPNSFINEVWMQMFDNPRHTYQILTKRPERLLWWTLGKARATSWPVEDIWPKWMWVGTSVENQHWADIRIPLLLQTRAAVTFISAEPLLGALDLREYLQTFPYVEKRADGVDIARYASPLKWVIVGGESGAKAPSLRPRLGAIHPRSMCRACSPVLLQTGISVQVRPAPRA
jgi:protein gp37